MKLCEKCNLLRNTDEFKERVNTCQTCFNKLKKSKTDTNPYTYCIENINNRIGESTKIPRKRIETYLNNAFILKRKDSFSVKLRNFSNREEAKKYLDYNFIILKEFSTREESKNYQDTLIIKFKPKYNDWDKYSSVVGVTFKGESTRKSKWQVKLKNNKIKYFLTKDEAEAFKLTERD